ncbi:MAG: hypothetical protein QXF52_10560 [Thermoproteota archaeon]
MKIKTRSYGIGFMIIIMIMTLLSTIVPTVTSQPQGYTLVYSAPRTYGVDWMDIKAVYMKTEENRLYFYVEYYGAIPNSKDYYRSLYIYMDTDRNTQTGSVSNDLGRDYYIYFYLYGDNSTSYAYLYRWNSTSLSWWNIKILKQNMKLAPELSYMEIWVDQQDIGYTSRGMDFYINSYAEVKAMLTTELNYVVGSSMKQINIDGNPGDWGDFPPSAAFQSRSINPPEMEVSNIYVANDADNLYIRIDTRGTPTASINTGSLTRWFTVYFDADNNNNTGYRSNSGAEFYAEVAFHSSPGKSTYASYYRYTGTGSDWNWQYVSSPSSTSDFNSVFEFKVSLSYLGLSPGQQVGLYMGDRWWYLSRSIPKPVYYTTYPPTTTTTGGIIGFFGSETVFLAVVVVAMVAEAAIIVLLMRRGRAPPPPPPA